MNFLRQRPAHTFAMAGLIRDNGIDSPHNRGSFYACLDPQGTIRGVALIGHATLFEARSDMAVQLFARAAQNYSNLHVLLGEEDRVNAFWRYYSRCGQTMRLSCRERLMELQWPNQALEEVATLRRATLNDLELILPVHARTALEESGVDPRDVDAAGFRDRCARRVQKGRTWLWIKDGRVCFKAEVVSDTPEVIYLEGVVVSAQEQGKGYGLRCITQLARHLLERTKSICLFVNEKNSAAQAFYDKAGFRLISIYDTIFLERSTPFTTLSS
jgi:predicted GNAT family acetyltransferase